MGHILVPWISALLIGTAIVSTYINYIVPEPYLVRPPSIAFPNIGLPKKEWKKLIHNEQHTGRSLSYPSSPSLLPQRLQDLGSKTNHSGRPLLNHISTLLRRKMHPFTPPFRKRVGCCGPHPRIRLQYPRLHTSSKTTFRSGS